MWAILVIPARNVSGGHYGFLVLPTEALPLEQWATVGG